MAMDERSPLSDDDADPISADLATSVVLVQRAQAGDRQALSDLFARYHDRVHRIVCIRLGTHLKQYVESVDIVQETFLAASKKFGDFEVRSHASIIQWLARIALNKVRDTADYHFAEKRDRGRTQALGAAAESQSGCGLQLATEETSPGDRAARREEGAIVDEAMLGLPDDYREVILLRHYYRADWTDIAEKLSRSKGASEELLRRAKTRLRSLVRSLEPNADHG